MSMELLDKSGLAYFWTKIKAYVAGLLSSKADDSDVVHKAGDEDITGTKTFVGSKKIAFKQSTANDKLGFTLFNNSNVEKGYLEYNPTNQISGVPLMTLGNYATAAAGLTYVGFRKYSNISGAAGAYNLLTPLISDAKAPFNLTTTYTNFFLPLGVTDGTTTVVTDKSGLLDISSLLVSIDSSDAITAMTGYSKPSSGGAIAASDSLNAAIGKLEFKVDSVDDSNYVHLTGNETVSGTKTFSNTISGSIDGNAATASAVAWSGVMGKPTTIGGYGITDAKIANGTITLGSNSITPLTSVPSHNQASNTITAMTGYSKPSSGSAITVNDSLNAAIGKLEAKLDTAVSAGFPSGTRMLFQQSAAPTGWTKETGSGYNNIALRLTTGNVVNKTDGKAFATCMAAARTTANKTQGGTIENKTAGGTISNATAGGTVGNKALSVAMLASHSHVLPAYHFKSGGSRHEMYATDTAATNKYSSETSGSGSNHNHSFTGSEHGHTFTGTAHNHTFTGSAHNHTIDLDINYIDCIIASKA